MPRLEVGDVAVDIEAGLAKLAESRCDMTGFEPQRPSQDLLRLLRVDSLDGFASAPLNGENPAWGAYHVAENLVRVKIPNDPFAAEAAIKGAVAVAMLRQRGLLAHAAAVRFGENDGVVFVGPSGAGKSTIARHCVAAGGVLLSDETVGFLPQGIVIGTPFRSEPALKPAPGRVALRALFGIQHGAQEEATPLDAADGAARILAQAYQPAPGEAPPNGLLSRASYLASVVGMKMLTCRNHPDAGWFVARWLDAVRTS